MKDIFIPVAEQVVLTNKLVCERSGSSHACYDIGKIESAIYTALYPGTYPFEAGGLARVAGALCFYLTKAHAFMDGNKRTAVLVAVAFLKQNGWSLKYAINKTTDENALADIVDSCAAGKVTKDQLMEWFDLHKIKME